MLARIAQLAIATPRRVLVIAVFLAVVIGAFGVPVAQHLSPSGFQDPTSQSSRATAALTQKFGQGDVPLVIVVTAPDRFDAPATRKVALDVIDTLKRSGHVAEINSAWTSPPQAAAAQVSRDRKSGLITTGIVGTEAQQQSYTKSLTDEIDGDRDGIVVRSGGTAMVNLEITEQSKRDLVLLESTVVPLSFLVLIWVFGGLFAAALPVVVGVMAILGALAVLRTVTLFTDVSIFALNLTTAMGLALAIDYTLLMISRYRDELEDGASREQAVTTTLLTAGRTVLFSAVTVALAMSVMVVFPMNFLRSFAYAGVATVTFASMAAIFVTPAAIMLLGDRLDSLDVRRLFRRILGRPEPPSQPWHEKFWYRSTKFVMRRAVPIGLAVIALHAVLGAPFFGVRPGFPDDRVLPKSASAHQVGDLLRSDFALDTDSEIPIVVVDSTGLDPAELRRYAADLSRVADVTSASAPAGTFQGGTLVGPPTAPTGERQGATLLTVGSSTELFSRASEAQLTSLHAVAPPGGRTVEFTGLAQTNRDSVDAILSRLPLALGLIAGIMLVLLFLALPLSYTPITGLKDRARAGYPASARVRKSGSQLRQRLGPDLLVTGFAGLLALREPDHSRPVDHKRAAVREAGVCVEHPVGLCHGAVRPEV